MTDGEHLLGGCELILSGKGRFPDLAGLELEAWIRDLLHELAPKARTFAVRFVGRRGMKAICREFYPCKIVTDVLSFPGEMTLDGYHLGDLVICIPEARRQAARASHPLERELKILLLHGVLHCLGYDHEADGGEMFALEQQYRRNWIDCGSRQ